MTNIYSMVMIVPASEKDEANKAEASMGYDDAPIPRAFAARLSATGREPATHFGCHRDGTAEFKTERDALKKGRAPKGKDWGRKGTTKAKAEKAMKTLIVSVRPADHAQGHFDVVIAANSLQRINTDAI